MIIDTGTLINTTSIDIPRLYIGTRWHVEKGWGTSHYSTAIEL